jgi:hypothetical protein
MIVAMVMTAMGLFTLYWAVEKYNSIPRMWVTSTCNRYGSTYAYHLPFKVTEGVTIVKTHCGWEVVDGVKIKRIEGMVR